MKENLTVVNACVSPDMAVEILKSGGVLIYPTETFFAVGNRAFDIDATARVFKIKKRSNMHPLPLILGEIDQLDMLCRVPTGIHMLLDRFWPGPLSVILPARLRTPEILTGGTGKVAVRVSSHPVSTSLSLAIGEPLTSSSANISGIKPVITAEELDSRLLENAGADGILNVLPMPFGGLPSTLVEPLCRDPRYLKILRHGSISQQALQEAGFVIII